MWDQTFDILVLFSRMKYCINKKVIQQAKVRLAFSSFDSVWNEDVPTQIQSLVNHDVLALSASVSVA